VGDVNRLPLITPDIQPRVYRCIQKEVHRMNAQAIAIGGIADHVHVLVRYPPAVSVSELIKQMKGVSSRLVHDQVAGDFFKWQGSYGAFSIAERDVAMVRRYVHRQEEHHRTGRLNATLERTMIDDDPADPPAPTIQSITPARTATTPLTRADLTVAAECTVPSAKADIAVS